MNTDSRLGWHVFDNGKSIGKIGSEGGVIVRDEENDAGARVTLERIDKRGRIQALNIPAIEKETMISENPGSFFAITMGIYDWMVHTVRLGIDDDLKVKEIFDGLKFDIVKLIEIVQQWNEVGDEKYDLAVKATQDFVDKYPYFGGRRL